MRIVLSEAAHCEHAGAYGYEGASHILGNQTGDELRTIAYYNLPWVYVLRCKNKDIREACARRSFIATTNMHIGYGQPTRGGLKNQLDRGIDICNIIEDCDCDCSSLQSGVAWYTLKTQGITSTITGEEYTKNMYEHFMASGWYEDVTSQIDLATGKGLFMGDILLTPGKHTANVYSVTEDYNTVPKWVGKMTAATKVYEDEKNTKDCEYPLLGVDNLVDVCDEVNDQYYIRIAAKYYGFVPKTSLVRRDPVYKTGTVKEALNLRIKPLTGTSITVMRTGSKVQIKDTVKADNGADWYLVNYNNLNGYCSAKYVKVEE